VDQSYGDLAAFDRAVRVGGAQRVTELAEGVVVRHDELPRLHHLNALLLGAPLPEWLSRPAALTGLADRALAGLGHRLVVLDDFAAAERLAPALLESGWSRQRVQYMLRVRGPDREARGGLSVRRLDEREATDLARAITAEEAPAGAAAVVEQLVAGQAVMRAATHSMVFGASERGGPVASACTVFVGDGIAMIDEVGTLTDHRQRGLARAVVSHAVSAARELGCSRVFVPAEIDDWPQLLYLRLGFVPVARQVSFTLVR
jgi:GNAT superfamily N-acetyltransferase